MHPLQNPPFCRRTQIPQNKSSKNVAKTWFFLFRYPWSICSIWSRWCLSFTLLRSGSQGKYLCYAQVDTNNGFWNSCSQILDLLLVSFLFKTKYHSEKRSKTVRFFLLLSSFISKNHQPRPLYNTLLNYANIVLWFSHCKFHRYVATPPKPVIFSDLLVMNGKTHWWSTQKNLLKL